MVSIKIQNKILEEKDVAQIPEVVISFPENIKHEKDIAAYCSEVEDKLFDFLKSYYGK